MDSDDDLPPPLEDMSAQIELKQKQKTTVVEEVEEIRLKPKQSTPVAVQP
jgi:hypothetical protein